MGDNPRFYSYDGESYSWFDTLAEAKAEAAAQLAGFCDAAVGDGEWNDLVEGVSWGVEIGGAVAHAVDDDPEGPGAVDYTLDADADGLVARLAAALRAARPIVDSTRHVISDASAAALVDRIDALLAEVESA